MAATAAATAAVACADERWQVYVARRSERRDAGRLAQTGAREESASEGARAVLYERLAAAAATAAAATAAAAVVALANRSGCWRPPLVE